MDEKVFLRLREIEVEFPDGSIFGIGRLERVTEGWVVRIEKATDFEGQAGMFKALAIAKETTGTVAGSKFDEVELWDVVEIFADEMKATAAGIENHQMTIYQIETQTLKWLE
jgi:uncharacterized RmlC-like cupin family protein